MQKAIRQKGLVLNIYPKLLLLGDCPAFIGAIADDYWLADRAPYLAIPDLATGEDAHWQKLVSVAPDIAKFDSPELKENLSPEFIYARSVRRAAVRTICIAAGLGSQTLLPTSHFGGDSSIKLTPAPRLNCRIGRLNHAAWNPTPTMVGRAIERLSVPSTIKAVETAIFPLMNCENTEDYAREYGRWAALAQVRAWESTCRAPVVGVKTELKTSPGGYVQRYAAADIEVAEVPMEVAAKIASPYASEVVRKTRLADSWKAPASEDLLLWATKACEKENT